MDVLTIFFINVYCFHAKINYFCAAFRAYDSGDSPSIKEELQDKTDKKGLYELRGTD